MYQTFCLRAFSDSGSLMNKYAVNFIVKFLYCCVINGGDFNTFAMQSKCDIEHYSTEKYQIFVS